MDGHTWQDVAFRFLPDVYKRQRTIWLLRGKDPVTSHSNTIMDYTFYWFLSVYDDYMYSGEDVYKRQAQSNGLTDMSQSRFAKMANT